MRLSAVVGAQGGVLGSQAGVAMGVCWCRQQLVQAGPRRGSGQHPGKSICWACPSLMGGAQNAVDPS